MRITCKAIPVILIFTSCCVCRCTWGRARRCQPSAGQGWENTGQVGVWARVRLTALNSTGANSSRHSTAAWPSLAPGGGGSEGERSAQAPALKSRPQGEEGWCLLSPATSGWRGVCMSSRR